MKVPNPYRVGGSYYSVVAALEALGIGKMHSAEKFSSAFAQAMGSKNFAEFKTAKPRNKKTGKPWQERIPASRREVETQPLVRVPHILISIRDPGSRKPRLLKHRLRRETLFLAFHDAEPVADFSLPPDIKLMTPKQAAKVWAFVLKHIGEIEAVVVNCEQGMSRSPAVAAGLLIGLGMDAKELIETYQPNAYVLRLMLDARPLT